MAQWVKNLPAMQEMQILSLSREYPLKEGMATHSSVLAWINLWTEESDGLQTMVSQRVRHESHMHGLPGPGYLFPPTG